MMIKSDKTQSIIIATTLVLGIISAGLIVSNASYYSGSYAMVHHLDVSLYNIRVTNLDPSNESIIPGLYLRFNFRASDDIDGSAALNFAFAYVFLNYQAIQYAAFRSAFPVEHREIFPGYSYNLTLSRSILEDADKQLLYDAYTQSNWTWSVTLSYWFSVFSLDNEAFRTIGFSYSGAQLD
jgi:hypothetical protein